MGNRGTRVRVVEHVYRDRYGYEVSLKRAGKTYATRHPLTTSRADLQRALAALLERVEAQPESGPAGSLSRDIARYCTLAAHLSDVTSQRAHLRAAVTHLGPLARHQITRAHILAMRAAWIDQGVKPATVNNRLSALRSLWHLLDGDEAPTPMDGLRPLKSHRTPHTYVSADTIRGVEQQLAAHEIKGWLRDRKTRARFRVLATTGARPSELMRAQKSDVDLFRRVWHVRDGKGGYRPVGVPLTSAAVLAWQLFIEADAWGAFNVGSFAKRLREAGWPAGVRPYALRASLGMALSEAGVDLADISLILGHTRVQTTRTHYVGPAWQRMTAAMGKLEGRLTWVPAGEPARRDDSVRVHSSSRQLAPASRALEQGRKVRRKA